MDPLIPGEPADVREQRMAFKADLRILNGVWYLRDPDEPARLGTPIWSDRRIGRIGRLFKGRHPSTTRESAHVFSLRAR